MENENSLGSLIAAEEARIARQRNFEIEKERFARTESKREYDDRVKKAESLLNSPLVDALVEAGKGLSETGHNPQLSVTKPFLDESEALFGDHYWDRRPIDLKLIWDISEREDYLVHKHSSQPVLTRVFSWREVNARLERDYREDKVAVRFNVHPDLHEEAVHKKSFVSGFNEAEVLSGITSAIANPLYFDETWPANPRSPHLLAQWGKRTELLLSPVAE